MLMKTRKMQNIINERIKLPFVDFISFTGFYVSKAKYLGKLEGMGPKKVCSVL